MKRLVQFALRFRLASIPLAIIGLLAFLPVASFASGLFYIDSDTGFAGFGNVTPQARVDVSGAIYSRLVSVSSSTVDWNQGNVQQMILSSSPVLSFSNGQAGGTYTLILAQDGTGGRTLTWPSSVLWPNGIHPAVTSAANATDTASFVYDGTHYLGSFTGNYKAFGCGFGVDIGSGVCRGFITTTGAGTWTVPNDWNSSDNTIEAIGGGGGANGGGGSARNAGSYAKIANLSLTPGTSVHYTVGAGGQGGNPNDSSPGGDTFFNGTTIGGSSVGAPGGGSGSTAVGTTVYAGGAGALYDTGDNGGGGGGGAAGPNGAGGNATRQNIGPSLGAQGDNGYGGIGGSSNGANGSGGTEWDSSHGAGGGGAGSTSGNGGNGGLYGGAAGGGFYPSGIGGSGAQGIIVITYTP